MEISKLQRLVTEQSAEIKTLKLRIDKMISQHKSDLSICNAEKRLAEMAYEAQIKTIFVRAKNGALFDEKGESTFVSPVIEHLL